MGVVNGETLFRLAPIEDMIKVKIHEHGVSHGRSEAGYDIRIKQMITFGKMAAYRSNEDGGATIFPGHFVIASSIERFQMPNNLMGIVHDKSSWARQGLSVFNTVIEPGWYGYLTLELVYHGEERLIIPAGSGIAQVVFHSVTDPVKYTGRYQGQEDRPVPAIQAL